MRLHVYITGLLLFTKVHSHERGFVFLFSFFLFPLHIAVLPFTTFFPTKKYQSNPTQPPFSLLSSPLPTTPPHPFPPRRQVGVFTLPALLSFTIYSLTPSVSPLSLSFSPAPSPAPLPAPLPLSQPQHLMWNTTSGSNTTNGMTDSSVGRGSTPLSNPSTPKSYRNATNEQLGEIVFQLQRQLIERDATIHRLNSESQRDQDDDARKEKIKAGFSAVERRNVDTATIDTVLSDSTNHILYTLSEVYKCKGGLLLLDTPYNSSIKSSNTDVLRHILLRAYFVNGGVSGHTLIEAAQPATSEAAITSKHAKLLSAMKQDKAINSGQKLEVFADTTEAHAVALQKRLSNLALYRDVIIQKTGRVYSGADMHQLNKLIDADNTSSRERHEDVFNLMAIPIVVEATTIGVVVLYNSDVRQGHHHHHHDYDDDVERAVFSAERDPPILHDILPELWTSGVNPLLTVAIDRESHKKTEETLAYESQLRDEIILSLDSILDEVSALALQATSISGGSTSRFLWKAILQKVTNYFEDYFASDCLIAVTNSQANFKLQRNDVSVGSRTPKTKSFALKPNTTPKLGDKLGSFHSSATADKSKAQSTASVPVREEEEVDDGAPYDVRDVHFVHYVFCDSLKLVKAKNALDLPVLAHAGLLKDVLGYGQPHFLSEAGHLQLPCGHMKITNMLLVPIIFMEEPVGLLGLANGEFSVSSGRILQSVFTTFWSMIVKATLMSENQKVLDAALPPQISERLKQRSVLGNKRKIIADKYKSATVFFADIVGFTSFTKELEPWEVVEFCNLIFAKLDGLVKTYHLEMIQVIGDCYMCAGGITDKSGEEQNVGTRGSNTLTTAERRNASQLKSMIDFALHSIEEARIINGMTDRLDCSPRIKDGLNRRPLQFRIGVAEGPLTAGIFGSVKMQYDIIGETVNFAARLEGSGSPGCIHVNTSIRDCLADDPDYTFEARQPLSLKGLGLHQTYFLRATEEKLEQLRAKIVPVVPDVPGMGSRHASIDASNTPTPERHSHNRVGADSQQHEQLEKIRKTLEKRQMMPQRDFGKHEGSGRRSPRETPRG